MNSRLLTAPTVALPVAALALATAGCSVSVRAAGDATGGLSRAQVEAQVDEMLQREVGVGADAVDCPEPLVAEVGAAVRCTLTVADDAVGATVTMTAVDGGDVVLDIAVDDTLVPVERTA